MTRGTLFDIREFAVNDGPGIRTTAFMKGCPLRCRWCHNPEGLLVSPQQMVSSLGESRICGLEYDAHSLAMILRKNSDVFEDTGGGITFSGGEPLMQAEFVAEVICYLQGIPVLLDTSGYTDEESFRRVASRVQYVYYDLKLMDPGEHYCWTGKDNGPILHNLAVLDEMKIPYTIRVPLIPSVTDTLDNLSQIAAFVGQLRCVQEVNLLPYNYLAGAKYESVGMKYQLDVNTVCHKQEVPMNIFSDVEVPVRILQKSVNNL